MVLTLDPKIVDHLCEIPDNIPDWKKEIYHRKNSKTIVSNDCMTILG